MSDTTDIDDATHIDDHDEDAPIAGFHLGDPIALHDLLALPPDGRRFELDARGRLALMSPDSARRHRVPFSVLNNVLSRSLDWPRHQLHPEPTLALPRIYGLKTRRLLPASRLGPKSVEPDLTVFAGAPAQLEGFDVYSPERLLLVVEVLSPKTHRSGLGRGRANDVDRWRTYLESGVPEYWAINAGTERAAIPPRSGLFLRNDGGGWRALGGEGLVEAATFRGLPAFGAGTVRSAAIPGLTLDLGAYWAEACR